MERSIPVWILVLCLILWMVLTVMFGWLVKLRAQGVDRLGSVGAAALEVASFPSTAKQVVLELVGRASGDAEDQPVRTRRAADVDLSTFVPVESDEDTSLPGLFMRGEPSAATPGWRLVVGAFAGAEGVGNMALLISPEFRVVHHWLLTEIKVGEEEPQPENRKFIHGMEILQDGSLVFTFDGGVSIQRLNACGERSWIAPGDYNHNVSLDATGRSVWTLRGGNRLVKLSLADGAVQRDITMQDIIDANPAIDILEIRRLHENDLGGNSRNTIGRWMIDSFHLNDVDPLPNDVARSFPEFAPGDLLVSARSLNLLFVLDPETLQIKWWRIGQTQRQHDPDWLPSGEIMVFNNRMSRDYSEIVAIDPMTLERRTVFDGRRNNFYSRIRGKAQRLPSGSLIVTSPQQGRAFEVAPDGKVVFEMMNTKPGSEDLNYVISEVRWLAPDYFRPNAPCIPQE